MDKSGALTLNQFHAWCLRLARKGTSDELASEARRDIKQSVFIPLLMLINPTVQPWRLTAMEFVIMVRCQARCGGPHGGAARSPSRRVL